MTSSRKHTTPPVSQTTNRRHFLRLGALAAAASCVPRPTVALERTSRQFERSLNLYNTHTGESLNTIYWIKGEYIPRALEDINFVLRDHHTDLVNPIDPQLIDLLYTIDRVLGASDAYHIVSAYRSPATNAMLRMQHYGVAEHSMHIEGKAVDIRLPGAELDTVRRLATALQWGGVGSYSSFVHLDTGPVRSW